ncbi:MAG: CDP-alcohol phosphatidyltransferase family protein [Bdellovibrionota bacterium]
MRPNLIYSLIWAGILLLIIIAYCIRVMQKGRPTFDRVERQGESRFLGKRVMELGYWLMQPLSRRLVTTGVSANQISWASFFFGLAAGFSLAIGRFGLGGALAVIAAFMDMLDGMVARLSGEASQAGEVLDTAMDRYVEFFFLSGLIFFYRDRPALLVLSLLALLGSFLVSYSSMTARAERIALPRHKWSMRRPERVFYLVAGALLSPVALPYVGTIPMVFALGLVTVFANYSAAEQFLRTIRAIRHREKPCPS